MVLVDQLRKEIISVRRFFQKTNDSSDGLERTISYVAKNIVPAREGRKCVDGRYTPDESSGMIAKAGGDCGYVIALMAINQKKKLGLTPEQCFNAVYSVIQRRKNGPFCIHTDHHIDPENGAHTVQRNPATIGCGHLLQASSQKNHNSYNVDNADVKRVISYARNLSEINNNIDIVNLDGEHREQGVLLIESDMYTINARDMSGMYFIYDKTRDEAFMQNLVKSMAIPGVTFKDMKQESDIQLQATLHNLAKGLPVYHVTFKGKIPQVTYLSTID